MGCKQSKAVRVQPVGAAELSGVKLKPSASDAGIEADINERRRSGNVKRSKSSRSRNSMGSCESIDDELDGSDRYGSAGSKKSHDSGLGDLGDGEYNHGFITEHSDPDKVKQIESEFKARDDLELGITGVALNTRNSAKDKARLEESMILQKLREEGLISKPAVEKTGAVSFDIVEVNTSNKLKSLPPVRLAKLERRRKKKRVLTDEEIQQKLERAEERRKRKEKDRLEKIKDMDRADLPAALESFADYQKKKEEDAVKKMESVTDNKERRLREIKEKQLERERKREDVRRRRKERLEMEAIQAANGEIVMDTAELLQNKRELTPDVPE
ncbi:trichohyalin-like [Dreissena polymorpha]|uniref:Uncharacterized protein n=1 Tax=Dreissena polymorpha TaxID=45954 RepID=A0A9D3YCN3_DREPO|nr:trichohyalin-like [Dreissena polymorpha]KAH3697880.1 hypothetical protein DPMN_085392 [Dreissena polymorpha]